MQVSEAMTRDVKIANPNQSLHDVARIMADCDIGCLPVSENDRLVGMITDRDIAVRAVAQGKFPDQTKVREVMSTEVKYCYDDADISDVARNMGDIKLHRLPVVDREKHLVGILAIADVANYDGPDDAGEAICGISAPASATS